MRYITLGQIGTAILKAWRFTYPIWRVVLAFLSLAFLMVIFMMPIHVSKDMRGFPVVGMSQIPPMVDWSYILWLGCFGYLFIYWVIRAFSDCDKKRLANLPE